MNILIFLAALICFSFAEVPLPRAATGIEVGIAHLVGKGESVNGTSWLYRFEMQMDPIVTFYGEAGKSRGKNQDVTIEQTAFGGGAEFDLLPFLGFRIGVASTIAEITTDDDHVKKQELGPMTGLCLNLQSGVFKFGSSAIVLRTETVHSTSLRVFGLVEF